MNPDDFKQAWQSQASDARSINAEVLLKELRRDDLRFGATIFWRDVREIGVAVLMVPLWFYLGMKHRLPWTWYLAVPGMLWIAGYLLVARMLQRRRTPRPGDPLRQCVASSLAQVEHQIWLLRNVVWWYLLPLVLPILAFVGHVAWRARAGGWMTGVVLLGAVAVVAVVFAAIYGLNRYAVRSALEPRRRELEVLLRSLDEELSA